jgi:hypothetical protein
MVDKQRQDVDYDVEDDEESAGWVVFAAMMLFLLGSFQALAGVVSLLEKSYYAVASDDLVVHVGYQAWGWTHLVVGVVAASAAFGLMTGATWARIVGIITAMASALVNIGFLAAAPVWAVLMITLDVLVIYAITAHGRDLAV